VPWFIVHAGTMSMSGQERPGRLIIVCGLPGSGKTALAKRLEDEYRGFRFCPDEWMAALGIDLFDEALRDRIEQLQWHFALRLLQLGQVAVFEWGTWGRHERDSLREGARAHGAAVELRVLDASVDALWERVRGRDMERHLGRRPLTRADIEGYALKFQRPEPEELLLYDPPLI
jgi:predicted kinase